MTVQEFLTDTLVLINVVDPGGSPSASETTHARLLANRILSSWSAAGVPVHTTSKDTVALTGATSYSRSGSNRPIKIRNASVVVGGKSKPVEIVTSDQWAAYPDRTGTGKFADILYCDYAYPAASVSLLPVPASGGSLELYCIKPLSELSLTLSDTLDLPPGYEQALQCALAVAVAPSYRGSAKLSDEILAGAKEAKEAIARLNAENLGIPVPAETPTAA